MSRVLVTGGSGFLGSWVVDALLAQGYAVRVFDRVASHAALDAVRPGYAGRVDLIAGEITDTAALRRAAEGCDALIHLAGVLTLACRADPAGATAINVMGGINAFEAARHAGIGRMAYVSSAGVFGPADGIVPRPTTLYGAHKLALEGFARSYLADHGFAATGLRPYVVYGPGVGSGISAGPSAACLAAARGEAAEIRFTGTVGFVHVADVAAAFVAAIAAPRDIAGVYTLHGETASVDGFVAELLAQVPDARISASGPPMPIAPVLSGDDWPDWLRALPVTRIGAGIRQTLAHWRG